MGSGQPVRSVLPIFTGKGGGSGGTYYSSSWSTTDRKAFEYHRVAGGGAAGDAAKLPIMLGVRLDTSHIVPTTFAVRA